MRQRRDLKKTEAVERPAEEAEWVVGRLVSYYFEGWRYGHITELNVNDDGELLVTLQPTGKSRKITDSIKDLKLA